MNWHIRKLRLNRTELQVHISFYSDFRFIRLTVCGHLVPVIMNRWRLRMGMSQEQLFIRGKNNILIELNRKLSACHAFAVNWF